MLLSARMFGLPWFWIVEGGDDAVQVVQDLTVHLGQTLLTAGFGGGDELQGSVAADVGEVRRNLAGSQTLAVKDNTISSMHVSRRWPYLMICGSKPLLVSRGTSISTARSW